MCLNRYTFSPHHQKAAVYEVAISKVLHLYWALGVETGFL